MKPKVSTGFLTPQGKKPKPAKKTRLSDREEENETPTGINPGLFEALLQDPDKKKMILQLLSLNKDVIDKHSSETRSQPSSVDKLKKKNICESPTALMRRRALEKMNGSPSTSKKNNLPTCPSSASSSSSSATTLDKVLEGVKAYVEIRDKHNEDKSRGAKEILKSMGATVLDKLTREVTHVVFKDGSYRTFQKAKLLRVHIVSILWVEFSRKALQKANEKRFPAMGKEFENETIVCSQMHKEYEDIIRDEYRKSILQGTPLPTTTALINRRRTLMTPSVTNNAVNNSYSSYDTAISSQAASELGAATIIEPDKEELIMNDPEGLTLADKEKSNSSDMELTNIQNDTIKKTPKRPYNNDTFDRRKTIGHSFCSDSSIFTAKFTKTTLESNNPMSKSPRQLQVSIEKFQITARADSGAEINVEKAISALKTPTNKARRSKSASSDDSEILLPPARIQRKTRRSVGYRDANRRKTLAFSETLTETGRRRSLAIEQANSDSSCDSFELRAKTAAGRRKTLASQKINSIDSINISLAPSQISQSARTAELTSDSSNDSVRAKKVALNRKPRRLKASKRIATKPKKHVTANDSDSDDGGSVTRPELTSDSSNESVRAKKVDLNHKSSKQIATKPKKHVTANDSDSDDGDSVTRPELTSDSSNESVRAKKVTLNHKSSKQIAPKPKKHVTANGSDSDDGESVTRAELTSDSSTNSLKQAKAKKVGKAALQKLTDNKSTRQSKKITSTASDSDNSFQASKQVKAKRVNKSAVELRKSSAKTHVTGDPSDTDKSVMKSRKLYDPNMSVHLIDIDDEQERQEKREQNKKRRLEQAGFVNPVTVLFDNLAKNATSSDSQDSEPSPPKVTKKPAEKPKKKASTNSTDDEQRQLLDEVLNRPKNPNRIGSRRKSLRILNSQSAQKATTSKMVPATPANRRSTMDFQSKTRMSAKKKIDKAKWPTIVCTGLHRSEVRVFTQIVKKLGRFVVEDEVSNRTTHVVAGEARRTLNMLRAIARGCWVLKHEWVLRSLEAGKWLPEENFEVNDYSPAVRKCRLERQAFGTNYAMDVFETCPPIYVALGTTPRCSDLRELIRLCKGKVVTVPRMARIIVGQSVNQDDAVCVTEKWVLDCVNSYKKMGFEDYLIEGGDKRKSFAV